VAMALADYLLECKSAAGLTVSKRIALPGDVPAIAQEITFHYAGKKEDDKKKDDDADDDKDEFELRHRPRTMIRFAGAMDSRVRMELALADRVERRRFYENQWCYPFGGLRLGAVAVEHETLHIALLALTDPATLGSVEPRFRSDLLCLDFAGLPEKLAPNRQATRGMLYAVGTCCRVSPTMVALLSLGQVRDGRRAIGLVARHVEARDGLFSAGDSEFPLRRLDLPGIGAILTGHASLPADGLPEQVTCVAGGETLELPPLGGETSAEPA